MYFERSSFRNPSVPHAISEGLFLLACFLMSKSHAYKYRIFVVLESVIHLFHLVIAYLIMNIVIMQIFTGAYGLCSKVS